MTEGRQEDTTDFAKAMKKLHRFRAGRAVVPGEAPLQERSTQKSQTVVKQNKDNLEEIKTT